MVFLNNYFKEDAKALGKDMICGIGTCASLKERHVHTLRKY